VDRRVGSKVLSQKSDLKIVLGEESDGTPRDGTAQMADEVGRASSITYRIKAAVRSGFRRGAR
jgi:hypothetical protein